MNIVLIGYRGTGKSAVGSVLAHKLGWPIYGFDPMIVQRAGRSIPQIVEEQGWEAFRDLETEVTLEYAQKDCCILDPGGGCILRPQNVKALKQGGVVFWLQASVPVIAERIQGDDQRPSLTGTNTFIDEISQVLEERTPKYQAAADFTIDTDRLSIEEVAERILDLFRSRSTPG